MIPQKLVVDKLVQQYPYAVLPTTRINVKDSWGAPLEALIKKVDAHCRDVGKPAGLQIAWESDGSLCTVWQAEIKMLRDTTYIPVAAFISDAVEQAIQYFE